MPWEQPGLYQVPLQGRSLACLGPSPGCAAGLKPAGLGQVQDRVIMYVSELAERLRDRTLAALAKSGRDRRRIRLALFRVMEELGAEAGREAWAEEYREFLLSEFRAALAAVLDEAVALEEFEWAAAVFRLKTGIL